MHDDFLKEGFINLNTMNHSQGTACNFSACYSGVDYTTETTPTTSKNPSRVLTFCWYFCKAVRHLRSHPSLSETPREPELWHPVFHMRNTKHWPARRPLDSLSPGPWIQGWSRGGPSSPPRALVMTQSRGAKRQAQRRGDGFCVLHSSKPELPMGAFSFCP